MRLEVAHCAQHRVQFLDHMHRQADGARLVHDGALDALADPPGGVGRETEAALRIELLQRVNQPEVAFLDQVQQLQAATDVVLGDIHHQPQVVLDHLLACGEIPLPHQARVAHFLLDAQQLVLADVVEVELGDVAENVGRDIVFVGRLFGRPGFVDVALRRRMVLLVHDARSGRYCSGSIGLPRRRISKCKATRLLSESPISAIF